MLYHHPKHLPCMAEAQIEEKGEKNERTKDEEASAMRTSAFPSCPKIFLLIQFSRQLSILDQSEENNALPSMVISVMHQCVTSNCRVCVFLMISPNYDTEKPEKA